ncbi:putative indole-3-acetic acid-amido synthetase GH3.5-like isoform X1 [Hibiscus syriacus]|uniref:Indole-3-acetic acid-amido synthetase GH3.5-like isoform X1 n=1 Tax=Hibiscus syriacus TaxID=106335 RepID=A0A6A2Z8C7_HIBSY|nr:uncharacterized protein LOC120149598 [Hibiscus syriacus]KAE8687786.1 putative indole-3-acetic acid-amido synthetase GH3.5-like isoform X1 [Hibiscus syriacus]
MGGEYHWETVPPTVAPLNLGREEHWRRFDNSVNAVSFGFVATAVLISMFLFMAIFERFLRPPSSPNDLESQTMFNAKLNYPSPKMTVYASEISVLMPGEEAPTFIAHPAPVPCPPDHTLKPLHQLNQSVGGSSSLS